MVEGCWEVMLSTVGLEVLVHLHVNGLRLELLWFDVYWVVNPMAVLGLWEQSLYCCLSITKA